MSSWDDNNDILLWSGNDIPKTDQGRAFGGWRRKIHLAEDEEWEDMIELRRKLCEGRERRPNRVEEADGIDEEVVEKVERGECTRRRDRKAQAQFWWQCETCEYYDGVCQPFAMRCHEV